MDAHWSVTGTILDRKYHAVFIRKCRRKALHVELPKVARTTSRDAYTVILGDFLVQWADLLATARGR